MRPKGQISPYKLKGRELYVATFFHPLLEKRVTRGLGTSIEAAAKRICAGLEILCTNSAMTSDDIKAKNIDPRAWNIFIKDTERKDAELHESPGVVEMIKGVFPELATIDIIRTVEFVIKLGSPAAGQFKDETALLSSLLSLLNEQNALPATHEALKALLVSIGIRLKKLNDSLSAANGDLEAIKSSMARALRGEELVIEKTILAHGLVKETGKIQKRRIS